MLRLLSTLFLLIIPTPQVFAQAAYHEPDPASLKRERQHADRALQEARRLSEDATLSDRLRAERDALGSITSQGRGPNFSLPPALTEALPFIDRAVGGAVAPERAPRPSSLDDRIRPLVLISFGMPDSQIRGLLQEAHRMKAAVIIRGLLHDDWNRTIRKLHDLAGESLAGVSIDPTAFTRFSVSRVPTFILPLERLDPCTPAGCSPVQHVRATGSASLSYFLDFVARIGTPEERHKARNWLAAHKGENP